MDISLDRRSDELGRVRFEAAIELSHDGFQEAFEAESVDLSAGGLALRSAYLPDVGTRLLCRFRCPLSEEGLEAYGEVVWANLEGVRSGEFGLRFLELDPRTQRSIGKLVERRAAETDVDQQPRSPRRMPWDQPRRQVPDAACAKTARVVLDGLTDAVTMRVVDRGFEHAVVEHELPVFEAGRLIDLEQTGAESWRGRIAEVELQVRAGMPKLVLRVDSVRPVDEPELDALQVAADCEVEEELRDTLRDMDPAADPGVDATMIAADSQPVPVSDALVKSDKRSDESSGSADHASGISPAERSLSQTPPACASASTRRLEAGDRCGLASFEDDFPEDVEVPGLRSWRTRCRGVTDRLRGRFGDFGQALPALGDELKQKVSVRLPRPSILRRKRRTTGPTQATQRRGRRAARAVFVRAAAPTLLGFGLMGVVLHTVLERSQHAMDPKTSTRAAQATVEQAAPSRERVTPELTATTQVGAPAELTVGPFEPVSARVAKTAPAASRKPQPTQRAVDRPRGVAKDDGRGPSFGAAKLEQGSRYTLRMTNPIKKLQGVADTRGFTVLIPGSLSLDRAGPIAAADHAVARSMILNRGDRAELTIRFAPGYTPRYKVWARGRNLHIALGPRRR
ncbi:MAG: PilZ domain-containing protein [Proteobacteria bacterium]|nr:PilZ domain-containing protein [Pseudomonadota bacterium]